MAQSSTLTRTHPYKPKGLINVGRACTNLTVLDAPKHSQYQWTRAKINGSSKIYLYPICKERRDAGLKPRTFIHLQRKNTSNACLQYRRDSLEINCDAEKLTITRTVLSSIQKRRCLKTSPMRAIPRERYFSIRVEADNCFRKPKSEQNYKQSSTTFAIFPNIHSLHG